MNVAVKSAADRPAATGAGPILAVKNIEVIYNHVILVLRGVSLEVPQGEIVALLGGNGAGKSTTLKSISTLLASERGAVTKGSIEFRGQRTDQLKPGELVGMGMVQVMEGRRCFGHLTAEENLITGAYARSISRSQLRDELDRIYAYFPRLKVRRTSLAGYTSGGEQQMIAIGRAMMAKPSMLLLDEPSMGLAPQIVAEIFEIVRDLNQKEGRQHPAGRTEHQRRAEIRRLRLHPGKRPHHDGRAGQGAGGEQGRQGVLPWNVVGWPQEFSRHEVVPPPQALGLRSLPSKSNG